ncbi:bb3-type cytochrome oxidase subunit III [Glaciimonas sp. GG7]
MTTAMTIKVEDPRRRPVDIRAATMSVAVWLFIGVATMLFSLFIAAYVMRMNAGDWSAIVMPWQLWISTGLLIAISVMLHVADKPGRFISLMGSLQLRRWIAIPRLTLARYLLIAGGTCGGLFLGSQLWGWQALHMMHVTAAGNPAASFFYLLTAMHGMHVVGGIVGWGRTARYAWLHAVGDADMPDVRWRIALCARYWDFLLLVWIALFAALGWLTPEVVRFICGAR